jgi:molybdate transport system regulatory protein
MKIIYKIWLENERGRAFGEGPYRLLRGIQETGSLRKAAFAMGLAYKKARFLITGCERSLGFALTRRKIGGVTGGGSEVTAEAVELMRKHEKLRAEAERTLVEAYEKHFGQSPEVQFYKVLSRRGGGKAMD